MPSFTGRIASQITFLYYKDLEPPRAFYEDVLGLPLVEDQGWARIYRTSPTSFVGLVDETRGSLKVKEDSAVMITFVVDDVPGWYEHLQAHGVKIRRPYGRSEEIQIEYFFAEDPGGYVLEFERFLKPELAEVFHLSGES